jgi:membrane protein DedA with SNARE-associated domain
MEIHMNKFFVYTAAAVVGAAVGYATGKVLTNNLPDVFTVKVPFGPNIRFTRKAGK